MKDEVKAKLVAASGRAAFSR